MFIPVAFAIALSNTTAFQLDYETEGVAFRASDQPQVLHRSIQRSEYDSQHHARRIVFVDDGDKTIMTFTEKLMTTETIHPDGTRQSISAPIASDKNPLTNLLNQAKATSSKQLYDRNVKEFKTIAGIRCHKHVSGMEFGGETIEQVEWVPVDQALAKRLFSLESYMYTVDGETRTLTMGHVITTVKLGKPEKR